MSTPICLTDDELTVVMNAARVLPIADRDPFLRQVAAALATQSVLGPGVVSRICREVQQRLWRAPDLRVGESRSRVHA
jgi:hypothetical protein